MGVEYQIIFISELANRIDIIGMTMIKIELFDE